MSTITATRPVWPGETRRSRKAAAERARFASSRRGRRAARRWAAQHLLEGVGA